MAWVEVTLPPGCIPAPANHRCLTETEYKENLKPMSKVTPLADRVIIKRTVEPESITPGGIVIPDNARTTSQEGTVVAVGRGKRIESLYTTDDGHPLFEYEPLQVKPGDRVLFGKYAGSEISIDDVPHVIMREDELLAVIAVEGKSAKV